MSEKSEKHEHEQERQNDRLVHGYNRMLERVRHALEEGAGEKTESRLHAALEKAKEKAVELGELTREEAEQVGRWLKRDLLHAADYLKEAGRELVDWIALDFDLLEQEFLEWFEKAVDQSRVELILFQEQLQEMAEWHTGEVTGPGVLECVSCGERLHFTRTARIPPCPKCHGTVFRRVAEEGED